MIPACCSYAVHLPHTPCPWCTFWVHTALLCVACPILHTVPCSVSSTVLCDLYGLWLGAAKGVRQHGRWRVILRGYWVHVVGVFNPPPPTCHKSPSSPLSLCGDDRDGFLEEEEEEEERLPRSHVR